MNKNMKSAANLSVGGGSYIAPELSVVELQLEGSVLLNASGNHEGAEEEDLW